MIKHNSFSKNIADCIINNDPDGVMKIIQFSLESKNKRKSCLENELSRITMYKALKDKNPKLKTLCKLISCCK